MTSNPTLGKRKREDINLMYSKQTYLLITCRSKDRPRNLIKLKSYLIVMGF